MMKKECSTESKSKNRFHYYAYLKGAVSKEASKSINYNDLYHDMT
jgi:hypothetical protein